MVGEINIKEIITSEMKNLHIKKPFTVGFTGPRAFKLFGKTDYASHFEELNESIYVMITTLYEHGAHSFISGMATGIDTFCAEAVLRLKNEGANVKLIAAVACPTQTNDWKRDERERFFNILKGADEEFCISEQGGAAAFKKRNLFIVDNCDVLVAFPYNQRGGTFQTINFAKKYEVPIIEYPTELLFEFVGRNSIKKNSDK